MEHTVKQEASATPKASDISDLDVSVLAESGIEVQIINPRTQEPTGNCVKVMGVFAPRFKELLRQAKKRQEMGRANPVAAAVAASEEDEVADLLAEVTLGWTMNEGGVYLTFSRQEALRVYRKYTLIRTQVFNAALDVANFVRG